MVGDLVDPLRDPGCLSDPGPEVGLLDLVGGVSPAFSLYFLV